MIKDSIRDLYFEHVGKTSDKWDYYLNEYDRSLNIFREQPISLLEIGVQNGGSLELWGKFFRNAENIIGSDIDPKCADLIFSDSRISVVIGDANADLTGEKIHDISEKFDIIIDDGSHKSGDIIKSFSRYFGSIKDGGVFLAEDLHCSYWKEFDGGLFYEFSAINFFKLLADIVNYESWGLTRAPKSLLIEFFIKYDFEMDDDLLAHIHSIEFFNSMCIVRKQVPRDNLLGKRRLFGSIGLVRPMSEDGIPMLAPNQECYETISIMDKFKQLQFNLSQAEEVLSQTREALSQTEESLSQANNNINKLLCSSSWRVTRPLRLLKKKYLAFRNC